MCDIESFTVLVDKKGNLYVYSSTNDYQSFLSKHLTPDAKYQNFFTKDDVRFTLNYIYFFILSNKQYIDNNINSIDEEDFDSDQNNKVKSIITEKNDVDKIFKNNKIKVLNFDDKINNQNDYYQKKGKTLNTFKQIKQKYFEERNINHFSNENSDPINDLKINLNPKKKKQKMKPLRAFHFTNKLKKFAEEPMFNNLYLNNNEDIDKNSMYVNKHSISKKKNEKIPNNKIVIPLDNNFDILNKSNSLKIIDNKKLTEEAKLLKKSKKSQINRNAYLTQKRKKDQDLCSMSVKNNLKSSFPEKSSEIQSYIDNKADISTNYNSFTNLSNYNMNVNNYNNQETNFTSNNQFPAQKLSMLNQEELDNQIKNTSYNEIYNMLMDTNNGDDYEFLKDLDLTKSQYLPLKESHSDSCYSFSNVFQSNQSLCGNNTIQSCFFNDPLPNCNQNYNLPNDMNLKNLSDKKLNPQNILEETSIDITKNTNLGDCLNDNNQIKKSENIINNTSKFEINLMDMERIVETNNRILYENEVPQDKKDNEQDENTIYRQILLNFNKTVG